MIYKFDKGGIVKLQSAWTTMPSVEDAILKAWANQSAKEKAQKQVTSEKPKYTYVNPYDYTRGWREATEDAAKQEKYTVENLGGSKEEAEAAYNNVWENARKQLAGTTATGLGTVALLGLSGGAAGPIAADVVNTGFGIHGIYNALSNNGIQKTVRLANQGNTWGAVKSGAGDLLDLSMGAHAAKLWGNLGKSMLAGQSLGNAYRGNVAGREMLNGVGKFTMPYWDFIDHSTYDLLKSELTNPNLVIHVSPNNIIGGKNIVNAARSNGVSWVPGKGDVSKINGENKIWLFNGKPYRITLRDNTYIALDKSKFHLTQTPQTNSLFTNEIPLEKADIILQRNPIIGVIERVKHIDPSKQQRVISEGTYPLYTGPQHSVSEVVNLDGTVNPRMALNIQREVADRIPGAYRMEARLENPEWHTSDPTTWDHTKQVARSAWTVPTPKGFTKQDQMVAALGHDFGKIVAGEGHGPIGADLVSQIFPDVTAEQLTAIREHMGTPKTSLGLVTKQADILNGQPAIIRNVQPNGKIRLSLPSHTDSNPRQFVLEPQGKNKFYVHMRTWDGDHIPANLSSQDKTTLFNALYEELPEGAEILFPQSGPGNYATRGTVAGLQHLARDSRFRPGGKGVLEYIDKDGTVKTFEGSSFIKGFPKVEPLSRPISEAERKGDYKIERNQPIKQLDYNSRELQQFLKEKSNIEQKSKLGYTLEEIEHLPEEYQTNALRGRSNFAKEMSDKMKNYFADSDKVKDFNKLLKDYASQIESDIDPRIISTFKDGIEQPSLVVRGFRNYLINAGVDASELSNEELAKILTQQYKTLSTEATGKLKDDILWHGSPEWFDSFDFTHTGKNTGNSGALGPGNYFSLIAGPYGRTKSSITYGMKLNNTQPYIITEIQSTPNGATMIKKGILPEYIGPAELKTENGRAKLNDIIKNIPKKDNRAYIDLSERAAGMGADYSGPSAGVMVRRNTGIKSLYPHPSRFIRNSDGTVSLIPTNWSDIRVNFKQGGILKAQNGLFGLWQKAYNSKFGQGIRTFMFGKDYNLSNEEYQKKYGYGKPNEMIMPWFTQVSAPGSIINLNKLGKVNFTLEPDKYWYVVHQTSSKHLPGIMKEGLKTGQGLNGTALNLSEDFLKAFQEGNLRAKGLLHKGSDAIVVGKFPKSKFPSGDLDDISIRLMDLGESSNFEVPAQYLRSFIKDQLKQGGILKAQKGKIITKALSQAEKLGIPKALRFNAKALEDPYYWGYQQWNSRYNAAVESGNIKEAQRLRDLHFKIKAPNTKVVDENGMPLHTYHGTMKHFTFFNNVNPKDIKFKTGGYHTADYNLAKSVYAKGGYYNPVNGKFFRKYGIVYDNYLNITNPFIDTPSHNISDIVGELTRGNEYPNWGSLNGSGRVFIKNGGFDGVFVPRYYNTYLPTNSAAQIKSADPITWNGKGEIVPIVKRDNFHNLDTRYKTGGILKGQNSTKLDKYPTSTTKAFLSGTMDYLLKRKNPKSFIKSKYRPTIGDNGETYYTRDGLKKEVALSLFGGIDSDKKFIGQNYFYKNFDDAYNKLSVHNDSRNASNGTLGTYAISAGKDDRGRYLSFADKFDFVTLPGKPIHIYDRIYEDELESLYNKNDSAVNLGDFISKAPLFKQLSK